MSNREAELAAARALIARETAYVNVHTSSAAVHQQLLALTKHAQEAADSMADEPDRAADLIAIATAARKAEQALAKCL